jgi:hypothetical protein
VDAGIAYLFDAQNGNLLQTLHSPVSSGRFGWSVALDGNFVAIGALGPNPGQVYVFDAVTGMLAQTIVDPTDTSGDGFPDDFGASVAANAGFIAIGAPRDDSLGFSIGQTHLYATVPEPTTTCFAGIGLSIVLCGVRTLSVGSRSSLVAQCFQ